MFIADVSYQAIGRREAPTVAAPPGNTGAPTVTLLAVQPVEEWERSKSVSGKGPGTSGRQDDGSPSRPPSTEAGNEGGSGCAWRLTYESELKRVVLELVERDSNALVMRIPQESLVKFLRSASDFASVRPPERTDARFDVVA
jgi:hypothetical protein